MSKALLLVVSLLMAIPAAHAADAAFDAWLRSLWPEAQRLGISRKVFDEATRGLEPDLTLPDLVIPGRLDKPPPGQAESTPTPGQWMLLGPQPITTSGLPFAGRVTVVAPHPTDANIIYIGTDGAGIWLSQDAGATWASLTDTLPIPHIRSLVIDPVDPRLLYATTIPRAYPTRLLRSTDSGRTWKVSSITTDDHRTVAPGPCAVNVFQRACIPPSSGGLFFDRSRAGSPNTSTIFFVGWSHILRSDNSGETFHEVFSLPIDLDFAGPDAPNDNSEAEFLRDATIDPLTPSRLYAAVAQPRCTSSSNGASATAQIQLSAIAKRAIVSTPSEMRLLTR